MGYNSRLDDIHAGVLSAKLKHIDAWNDLRRQWAAAIRRA
jgi:dTDP-4-amino-4,6-dideoxygalactose transaminase